jgi:DNA-binding NtrC family response regulator
MSDIARPPDDGRFRILVADDDPGLREYMEAILARLPNVDVTTVPSGEDGVAALERGWFDLILSDQRMGKLDGVHFLKRAESLAEGAPRVLVTAYGDMQLTQDAVNMAHVSRFLNKPFLPDDLTTMVKDLLSVRRMHVHREDAFLRAIVAGRSAQS